MPPTSRTRPVAELHAEADRALVAVLDAVPADGWDAPSPCEGWTARDVLGHLVRAQRAFLTGRGFDLGPEPDVDADPAGAWRAHSAAVARLLADDGATSSAFDGHFGPTTVGEAMARFYVFDMIVHRWDIARAVGRDERFTEEEMDRLEVGMEGFGPALYSDGVCEGGVEPPEGADRQARVLARLGRRA